VGATAVLKIFAMAPVDSLTTLLWRCLDFSKITNWTKRHRPGNW